MIRPIHAVLLAAGRGKRLAPHTDRIPKPLLPLNGRPLLEYALDNLRQAGIERVLLVVGYRSNMIRAHFGDGSSIGLSIDYVEQGPVAGTGAATLLAEDFVGGQPFFLGWGDILSASSEYARLLDLFVQREQDGIMLLERVEDPKDGAAIECIDGRIRSLVEKPVGLGPSWNQAGLSVYTASIFSSLRAIPLSERGELEFTAAVQHSIEGNALIRGVPLSHPRLHLTRPEDISRVEHALSTDRRYAASIAHSTRDD